MILLERAPIRRNQPRRVAAAFRHPAFDQPADPVDVSHLRNIGHACLRSARRVSLSDALRMTFSMQVPQKHIAVQHRTG